MCVLGGCDKGPIAMRGVNDRSEENITPLDDLVQLLQLSSWVFILVNASKVQPQVAFSNFRTERSPGFLDALDAQLKFVISTRVWVRSTTPLDSAAPSSDPAVRYEDVECEAVSKGGDVHRDGLVSGEARELGPAPEVGEGYGAYGRQLLLLFHAHRVCRYLDSMILKARLG